MDDAEGTNYFWVTVDTDAAPAVVTGRGEIDAGSAPDLLEGIDTAIAGSTGIELDLRAVTFIDSSGLRALTEVLRRSEAEAFTFRVAAMSEPVRRVFDMTGMTELLAP